MKNIAMILAAGEGTRMKLSINKHFLLLQGKPLVLHCLHTFQNHPLIDGIILVGSPEKYHPIVSEAGLTKLIDIVPGGETRQESCWLGLQRVEDADLVVVHDGARPMVDEWTITRVIQSAADNGAAIAAVLAKDTIKEVDQELNISRTPDRKILWQAQTPQVVQYDLLRRAHEAAQKDGFIGTDEASLVERLGTTVKISEGDYHNIKVTCSEDLIIAERFLAERYHRSPALHPAIRVGLGHDTHPFVEKGYVKPLVLGGVCIKEHRGLAGNSDGDVILHALFNALSQAVGEHSIGYYADALCLEEGITDSFEYLKVAHSMVTTLGYRIANVGISVECQSPRIEPISIQIKENIASMLGITSHHVGVTATSGEGLTAFGQGKGIQAWAIVSLASESQ